MERDELIDRLRRKAGKLRSALFAAADMLEADAKEIERLTEERDEALNQLDSARHSVDVLEKRLTDRMTKPAPEVAALDVMAQFVRQMDSETFLDFAAAMDRALETPSAEICADRIATLQQKEQTNE